MKLSALVVGEDGALSYSKIFALVFHVQLAFSVGWRTYKDSTFDVDMWYLYAVFAVGHVTVNKALSTLQSVQNRKIDAQSAPSAETITTTTVRGAPHDSGTR